MADPDSHVPQSKCTTCLETTAKISKSQVNLPIAKEPQSHKLKDIPGIYHPLDATLQQIRLLFIQPGKPASPLHCSLHTFNLTDSPPPNFSALSYEWGNKTPTKQHSSDESIIYLSQCGGSSASCIRIRENLFLALKQLRSETNTLILWIDALCVNQWDLRERSHQVGLMRQIYGMARTVHVWLGPEEGKFDNEPFELLHRIREEAREHAQLAQRKREEEVERKTREAMGSAGVEDGKAFSLVGLFKPVFQWIASPKTENKKASIDEEEQRGEPANASVSGDEMQAPTTHEPCDLEEIMVSWFLQEGDDMWQSLHFLLRRTYWRRIWIVQEFVLARTLTLHCGSSAISWDDFIRGLQHILSFAPWRHCHDTADGMQWHVLALLDIVPAMQESMGVKIALTRRDVLMGRKLKLLQLLEVTRESRCADPRDRVFALLGLASDVGGEGEMEGEEEGGIEVDYTKSVYAVQVDVMRFFRTRGWEKGMDLTYVSSLQVEMMRESRW